MSNFRGRPDVSNWQVLVLRWGGGLLAVVFAVALILVYLVFDTAEGETASNAPATIYWILLVVGVVATVVGFLKETDSSA